MAIVLTGARSLSACFLLSSTVLVMVAIFAVEDVLFPSKSYSDARNIELLVNIGRTRPRFQLPGKPQVTNPVTNEKVKEILERTAVDGFVESEEGGSYGNEEKEQDCEGKQCGRNVGPSSAKDADRSRKIGLSAAASGDDSEGEKVLGRKGRRKGKGESRRGGKRVVPAENPGNGALESRALDAAKPKEEREIEDQEEEENEALPPSPSSSLVVSPVVLSTEYYTKVYKHPVPKLRLLTEKDGAPRIRSNMSPPAREITIVTQTSADRLGAVEATCLTWGGALCLAVHVRLESQFADVYDQLKQMHSRVEESSGCRLDIQMVTEDGFQTDEDALLALYPVNALRNVALGMVETQLIFLLDADFKPSPRLHESLTEKKETYEDLLRKAEEERQLFVVPAFEMPPTRAKNFRVTVPETMEELREGWENKTFDCFHCQQSPTGHIPTKFKKFFDPKTASPYPISYRDGFEPYVIGATKHIPLYDARFRGYGENKVSHIYSCAADGMGFQVLPNVFVFELPHRKSQAHDIYIGKHKDPNQRYKIIGLYNQLKAKLWKEQMEKDPERLREFLHNLKRRDG